MGRTGVLMAKIVRQAAVCDGYDVRVALDTGEHVTLHFGAQPADVAAAVLEWVATLPEPVVYEIEGE